MLLAELVAVSRSFGLPLELIGPGEAQALFPLMTLEDVRGAVYLPTDGFIDPTGLTMALAAGARARGAQIHTHTRVQGIEVQAGRVRAVVTDVGGEPEETAAIHGVVTDAAGAPVSGARVNVCRDLCKTAVTDASGAYAFTALEAWTASFYVIPAE